MNETMRKIMELMEGEEQTTEYNETTVRFHNEAESNIEEFLKWVKEQAGYGTGVTITAETNGGEKKEMYIDGDGSNQNIVSISSKKIKV